MIAINEDQNRSGDDPLSMLRIRRLIAVGVAVMIGTIGGVLLYVGLYNDQVYTWTGGLACILSGVGVGVYAGQLSAADVALRQQEILAARAGDYAMQLQDAITAGLREIAATLDRIERQSGIAQARIGAAEERLGSLDGLAADIEELDRRQRLLAEKLTDLVDDEVRRKREQRYGG